MSLVPDKDKPSIPKQFLEEYNILIFSQPGDGKSSFLNAFLNSMILLFENSTKAMLSNDFNLSSELVKRGKYNYRWELFRDFVRDFNSGGHGYETLGVDTATRAYDTAMEYIINVELDGQHPSEMMKKDDSSGYSLLNQELEKWFGKMLDNEYGTVISAHADFKGITDIKGNKRNKLVPDTGGSFGSWLMGEVDIIIFLDKNSDGERTFRIEGTKDYDAKQRLPFQNDEINVECKDDSIDPGKFAYEKFKEEFDAAIEKLNERLGITEEMIENYYGRKEQEKEKQKKLSNLKDKIIDLAKEKQLNPKKNAFEMNKQIGVDKVSKISNLDNARKYIDYLKNYEG